jgi:hypothetical protein
MVPPSSKGMLSRKIEIPPERYMIDLELHDRYCEFSAQLLKLALAGLAGVGFFISTLTHEGKVPDILREQVFRIPALISIFCLALGAGAALLHRYLAADGMYYHFRAIKLLTVLETQSGDPEVSVASEAIRRTVNANEAARNKEFRWCGWLLFLSSTFLFAGAFALGVSLKAILE